MTKDKLPSVCLEHKAFAYFCSATILCFTFFVLLNFPDRGALQDRTKLKVSYSCNFFHRQCQKERTREEHFTQVVADLTKPLRKEEGIQDNGRTDEIDEWDIPAIRNDRPQEKLDDPDKYGEPRRSRPFGVGAFLFVQFGAYRGGPNTFAIVGLGTKGLHAHGNPSFECSWVSNTNKSSVNGTATKYLPDFGFGRQYSVVVVNCTFDSEVGINGDGGKLNVIATHGSSDQTGLPDVQFVALTEEAKTYNATVFSPPYRYDYLYCGSPLFGSISPQRMREWLAYHVRLFGPRSHFIFYDAGGIDDEVRQVIEPWIRLGFVTVTNIRQQARYDVYYFSQFLINNDCLFRSKSLANWTFFFDVDEYIHVAEQFTFDQAMLRFYNMGRSAQQVLMKQRFMNHNHCVRNDSDMGDDLWRKWGFEKLVYRRTEYPERSRFGDRKYAIQAQYALTTAVHGSSDTLLPEGVSRIQDTIRYDDWAMDYFHYHGTINHRSELCEEFVDSSLNSTKIDNATHVFDNRIATLVQSVREFEAQTIVLP